MGFWGKFGGFSEREPKILGSQEEGPRWASLRGVVASECRTTLAVLHVLTFWGVSGHP